LASRTKPTTNKEIATMKPAQVIELIEKYLADNDSITTDELERVKRDTATAADLVANIANDAAAAAASAAACSNYAAIAAAMTAAMAAATAAAYAGDTIAATKHIEQYHQKLAEQSK
jgi:hypothetical protein